MQQLPKNGVEKQEGREDRESTTSLAQTGTENNAATCLSRLVRILGAGFTVVGGQGLPVRVNECNGDVTPIGFLSAVAKTHRMQRAPDTPHSKYPHVYPIVRIDTPIDQTNPRKRLRW